MISPADNLRVAIALVALKHKPPSQSLPSCVLDLQSTFTLAATARSSQQQHSIDRLWRARAMQLESECAVLREQLQTERREKNVAVAAAVPGGAPVPGGQLEKAVISSLGPEPVNSYSQQAVPDSQSGKKKQKKNSKQQPLQQQQAANANAGSSVQSEAVECLKQLVVSLTSSGKSFFAMSIGVYQLQFILVSGRSPILAVDQLVAACSAVTNRAKKKDLVASSFVVAVETISRELGTAVASEITSGSLKAFDFYSAVLKQAVAIAIPLTGPPRSSKALESSSNSTKVTATGNRHSEHLERCLRVLSKRILLPCLQSFVPLSIRFLQDLRGRSAKEVQDVRYHILSVVRTVLTAVFSSSQPSLTVESLRMSFILDTLTELRQTLFQGGCLSGGEGCDHRIWYLWLGGHPTMTNRGSAAASPESALPDYENHIAKKDGVWFLCTVLHLLSSFDGLNDLVLRYRSDIGEEKEQKTKAGWDGTCEQMRKAVVDDVLQLLSMCRKALPTGGHSGGFASSSSTTRMRRDSLLGAKLTEASQDDSHAIRAPTPGQEAESHTSERDREVLERGGKCGVDEAEYEMLLATSERLLLVYTA